MSEFDNKARDWDNNSRHIERSEAVAKAIKNALPLNKDFNALEFGAGTALLSFALEDSLGRISLVDSSREMINVTKEKIENSGIKNMKAFFLDLEKDDLPEKFNLIYSQMAFHHLSDVKLVLKKIYNMLQDDGYLAIADLYPEDGSFHGEKFHGHKGFDPEEFKHWLKDAGFSSISHSQCYTVKKINNAGLPAELSKA